MLKRKNYSAYGAMIREIGHPDLARLLSYQHSCYDYTFFILGCQVPWLHELRRVGLLKRGTKQISVIGGETCVYEGEMMDGKACGLGK